MRKSSKSPNTSSKLPNAPLAEVVYELRWKLAGDESIPAPFRPDPGYYVCLDAFFATAEKLGFRVSKRVNPSLIATGHSVDFRFYKSEADGFPLLQLGPGIFAVNESSAYTWVEYKKLCLEGLKGFLSSYPKLTKSTFEFTQLELKYIDAFKAHTGNASDYLEFLNSSTNLSLALPEFLRSRAVGSIQNGQVAMTYPVSGAKDTLFSFSLGRAAVSGVQSIVLETKVITTFAQPSTTRDARPDTKYFDVWLEQAHEVISPFFKSFVKPSLMSEFRGEPSE